MIHNRIEFLTINTSLLSRRESYRGAYKRKIRELLCLETFSLEKKTIFAGIVLDFGTGDWNASKISARADLAIWIFRRVNLLTDKKCYPLVFSLSLPGTRTEGGGEVSGHDGRLG